MAYSIAKTNIILKGGLSVSEFYYSDDLTTPDVDDVHNVQAIQREAGLTSDKRLLNLAKDKYQSKLLPDRIKTIDEFYLSLVRQVLQYMNKIIWIEPPADKGIRRDGVGVLTGESLARAFDLGMKFGESMKAYDQYILELYYPTNILQRGLVWEKRNYLEDVAKNKDLSNLPKGKKSKDK